MSAPWAVSQDRFPAPWASDWGEDPVGLWQAFTYRGARQAFRWCPPGRFLMGSPKTELERNNDEVQHEVVLTRGFWLAEIACTQALWRALMGDNPSRFKGDRRPVETVSWEDAQRFIERLNAELRAFQAARASAPAGPWPRLGTGHTDRASAPDQDLCFRLPTEAEWEYACRAGTTGPFSFGEDIHPDQANYDGNFPYRGNRKGLYREQTVEVASLPPNPWGLYEMHGNVWEWCQDWYGGYPAGPEIDPMGPATGVGRVLRGGGWIGNAHPLRSAYRLHGGPGFRADDSGFRLALGPELGQARKQAGSGTGPPARRERERATGAGGPGGRTSP